MKIWLYLCGQALADVFFFFRERIMDVCFKTLQFLAVAKIIAVMTTPVTLVDEHEGTVKQNGRNGIVCGNRMNTVAS